MKARLIRFAFALHRWLGVALGLLMLMWCVSGVVMMYSPYPATSLDGRDYRLEGLAPITLPDAPRLPVDVVPQDAALRAARIEMLADAPVLHLAWQGGSGVFDLATGGQVAPLDEAAALGVARSYASRHGLAGEASTKSLMERDEFVVAGYFNSARPFWQARLNDPDGTVLYISQATGEVKQRTTASLRFWSWLGAIPHWLYFTELRKNTKLWVDVVIWTSLAGCFLTLLGLFVGLRQFRRRRSTARLASPYRGAKFWHHMLGLSFGLLVLTWTFSGFASMQPWGWLESGEESGAAAARLSGEPPTWAQAQPALRAQLARLDSGTLTLTSSVTDGRLHFIATREGGVRERLGADGLPAPFNDLEQQRAAELLAGDSGPAQVEVLETEDAFYYRGAAASRLPVVRVTAPAMQDTRFYLDHVSGQVSAIADPGARGFRWLHLGLHRIDFFDWLRARPLWDIVTLPLMLGVTAVCALGVWMGLRKLMRGGRLDNTPKG